MTHRVAFAPEAETQLIALHDYIAGEASSAIVERYAEAIVAFCESLSEFPNRGTPRDDLRPNLRTLSFRRRVTIAYAAGSTDVTILGIYSGGQDIDALLRED